jgi:hypothetical protein
MTSSLLDPMIKQKVYYANKGSYQFTLQTITDLSFFSQGASSGDFQPRWMGRCDACSMTNAANFTLDQ